MIYDIPDPFADFIERKYANDKRARYDFFAREWVGQCGCCGFELYAPNKKDYVRTRLSHTRNECLNGY